MTRSLPTDPIVPDRIRAAIHAGHIGQVTIFCDHCGVEHTADYTGETREIRFATARHHLATTAGWVITADTDLCPTCGGTEPAGEVSDGTMACPVTATPGLSCIKKIPTGWTADQGHAGGHFFTTPAGAETLKSGHYDATDLLAGRPVSTHKPADCGPACPRFWAGR